MARIGKPLREIDVKPVRRVTPSREPATTPAPSQPKRAPARKPEKVPA